MPFIYNLETGEAIECDAPEVVPVVRTPKMVKMERQLAYPNMMSDLVDAIHAKEKGDDSLMTAWVAAVDQVNADYPLPE